MAGRGPQPKPAATRQRTNTKSSATALPAKGRTDSIGRRLPVPKLLPEERDWHSMTLAWWEGMWRSPQATQWIETDKLALFRLAMLVEAVWRKADLGGTSKELETEIRLQEARFGVTVADRERLHWTIAEEDEVPARRGERPGEDKDPRSFLSVVEG